MSLKAVTFDCAGTLLESRWEPVSFALDCAHAAGASFTDRQVAGELFGRLLAGRQREYLELNLLRSAAALREFWLVLYRDWLECTGSDPVLADRMEAAARERLFGAEGDVFALYPDAIPTLAQLRARGLRLAVVSNWDGTLHQVLAATGIAGFFDVAVASLEHGFEKPDERIFQLALQALGVSAGEAAHVGDDPLDDLQGAQRAGLRAYLLDRSRPGVEGVRIGSLAFLPQLLCDDS